jgi:hypothetical protein
MNKKGKGVRALGPRGVRIKRDFILQIIRIYRSLIMINQKCSPMIHKGKK